MYSRQTQKRRTRLKGMVGSYGAHRAGRSKRAIALHKIRREELLMKRRRSPCAGTFLDGYTSDARIIQAGIPTYVANLFAKRNEVVMTGLKQLINVFTKQYPAHVTMDVKRVDMVIHRLSQLLTWEPWKIVKYSLRCLVNMAKTNNEYIYESIINHNILKVLTPLIRNPRYTVCTLQIIGDMAYGLEEHIKSVLESGVCPQLVSLLYTDSLRNRAEAICILSNIVITKDTFRNYIVECESVKAIVNAFESTKRMKSDDVAAKNDVFACCARFVAGIFTHLPMPPNIYVYVDPLLYIPRDLLLHVNNIIVVENAIYAIVKIVRGLPVDGNDSKAMRVLTGPILDKVLTLIKHKNTIISERAMFAISEAFSGNLSRFADRAIERGLLDKILYILTRPRPQQDMVKKGIIRYTLYCLTSLAQGTSQQAAAMFDSGIMKIIISQYNTYGSVNRMECASIICSIIESKPHAFIKKLVDMGCIRILCHCLTIDEEDLRAVVLNSISIVLEDGKLMHPKSRTNPYMRLFAREDAYRKLQDIQIASNDEIAERGACILKKFFNVDCGATPVFGLDEEMDDYSTSKSPDGPYNF